MTPLTLTTPDGTCPATLHGADLPPGRPGVILYMDAFGPRPALHAMAARLSATLGAFVLLPDLLYRTPHAPFDPLTAFASEPTASQLRALLTGLTQAMTAADTAHFLTALPTTGPIAALGYCMGGARALTAAGTYPARITAAASFHGGNLASDAPDSPHRLAPHITARLLIGTAGTDASFPPDQHARLALALREAGTDHLIETYAQAQHGWCVPDNRAFHPQLAQRHWHRLTQFLTETLA